SAFTPRTQAEAGREAALSKCTTWLRACTPRSVRPAAVTLIVVPAIAASAGSSASCTAPPPGWVCQPRKRLPSYSRPRASRIPLTELREQLLGLPLLRRVAVLHDFVEKLARAVLVAHLLVRLGEVELGGDFLPLRVVDRSGARIAGRAQDEAARGEVQRLVGVLRTVGFV